MKACNENHSTASIKAKKEREKDATKDENESEAQSAEEMNTLVEEEKKRWSSIIESRNQRNNGQENATSRTARKSI